MSTTIQSPEAPAKLAASAPEAEMPDEPAEDLGSPADTVIDAVTQSQQDVIDTVEAAQVSMLANLTRVQREMADFVSERLRKDMEAQQDLLRCKSFDEIRSVQSSFFRTAVDQYAQEATRLFRLGSEIIVRPRDRSQP